MNSYQPQFWRYPEVRVKPASEVISDLEKGTEEETGVADDRSESFGCGPIGGAAPSRGGTITLEIPIAQIARARALVAVVPIHASDLAVVEATDKFTGETSIRTIAIFLRIDRLGEETPKREGAGPLPLEKAHRISHVSIHK